MRTKYKAWAEPYIQEHPEVMLSLDELKNSNNVYLEIGSGKGQFLIDMAKKFPDKFFVGVERNVTCSGITAKKLVELQLPNARLMYIDAAEIVNVLDDNKLEAIFLNFSDPWPKKRHHKRRLTADEFLKQYHRVLKVGGYIYIKTDNDDLYQFTLENLENTSFELIYHTFDYQELADFDVHTEYENNFRAKGMPIHRIVVRKK